MDGHLQDFLNQMEGRLGSSGPDGLPLLTSEEMMVSAVLTVICTLVLLFGKGKKKDSTDRSSLPPMATPSVQQTAKALKSSDSPWFKLRNAKIKGFLYSLKTPSEDFVVCGDIDVARRVLNDKANTKPASIYSIMDSFTGGTTSMFTAEGGPRWRHPRQSTAPAFAPTRVGKMSLSCSDVLEDWIMDTLTNLVSKQESIDIMDEMMKLSLKTMATVSFQYDMTDDEAAAFIKNVNMGLFASKPSIFDFSFFGAREEKQASKDVMDLAMRILANHGKLMAPLAGTVLDCMVKDTNYKSDKERASDILAFLINSYESVAATVAWTMGELAKNTKEQTSLRSALRKAKLAQDSPDWVTQPDLARVVKESMRLFPASADGVHRTIDTDYNTKEYSIPKGSTINVSFLLLHRNPEYFDHPDDFNPSRWVKPTPEMTAALIPFAAGSRNCAGQTLAKVATHIIIGRLVQDYEWKLVNAGEPDSFVAMKPKGLRLISKKASA